MDIYQNHIHQDADDYKTSSDDSLFNQFFSHTEGIKRISAQSVRFSLASDIVRYSFDFGFNNSGDATNDEFTNGTLPPQSFTRLDEVEIQLGNISTDNPSFSHDVDSNVTGRDIYNYKALPRRPRTPELSRLHPVNVAREDIIFNYDIEHGALSTTSRPLIRQRQVLRRISKKRKGEKKRKHQTRCIFVVSSIVILLCLVVVGVSQFRQS